jgi:type II secretory pathway pseudopilin PulG
MRRRRSALTLVKLLVIIAILGLVVALLLPFTGSARGPTRRNTCLNNLKQIGLALYAYEQEHGTLPPAYTVDEEGNRLHSWRTLILPNMDLQGIYESIDLKKPWDDPVNKKAFDTLLDSYSCPSRSSDDGLTHYLAVVGPDAAFAETEPRQLSDVKDGPEHTIGLVEVDAEHAVHWMSPHDITPDEVMQVAAKGKVNHDGVLLAGFLDGHLQTLDVEIDPDVLQAMLTIADGEEIAD